MNARDRRKAGPWPCPAHPEVGSPIFRREWADRCQAECWTRIPLVDLRETDKKSNRRNA